MAAPTGWTADLTHRLRVLLHAIPLSDLRRTESYLDGDRQHYDLITLALRVFDLVVESMGLDHEVDSLGVRRSLDPLLVQMDRLAGINSDRARHDTVVERLLAALRNDRENRQPFDVAYTDFDPATGVATRRVLSVRLLRDYFQPDGSIALRLTNEAINLFLNALELELEDAQAAAEAVVQSQLARGKFDDAVRSARNAKLASQRYAEKITGVLDETRRDIRRVDWAATVPQLLAESLSHLDHRIKIERNILQAAEDQHDLLTPGSPQAQQVATVAQLIRECMRLHIELHRVVMRSHGVFLDEQGRQSFAPRRILHRPELRTQVLQPLLAMPRADANVLAAQAVPLLAPARAPTLLWLNTLVGWQLRPRRDVQTGAVPVTARDLESYGDDPLRYSAEVRERAEHWLRTLTEPTTLASMLAAADAADEGPLVLEVLTFRALQAYAPDEHDAATFDVASAGAPLRFAGYYGDDLLITPRKPMADPALDGRSSLAEKTQLAAAARETVAAPNGES